MSFVPVQNPSDPIANIKTFPITEGADDLEIQAVVVVDTDGAPIEVATDATVSGVGTSIVAALEDLLTELALKADLTETQPISAAALPLPAGAATATKQDDQTTLLTAIKAKTDNLDVALSTRAVTGLTDTQLRATPVPVSGPLTDTQLRASAVPVSAAALPLPSGAATSAKQDAQTLILGDLATEARLAIVEGILGDSRDLLGFIKNSNELIAQEVTLQSVDSKLNPLVNIDVASSTLATQATLALIKAKTDNLDTALSGIKTGTDKIPATPSQEHTTAASPHSARLSDGAAFYDAAKTGQLPAALVGGRLDTNVGAALPAGTNNIGDVDVLTVPADPFGANADAASATGSISAKLRSIAAVQLPSALVGGRLDTNNGAWLGSTAPTVGQKTMANSLPVTFASDQTALVPERSTAGDPVGVTVSTAAVIALASNASAKSRIITNNGTTNIYLGKSNTVTASGATMGIKLAPGGSYSDSGVDLYTGDIYAIGDAAATSHNLSAWERT